jgi:hypothetical protein
MASTRDELERLREVAAELTQDQRLLLACQVSLGMDSAEFCERFGWSPVKFRKVAERARSRLRTLLSEYELGERCRRLEDDVLAYAAHAASAAQTALVREHLANCMGCAAMVRDVRLASDRVAALLPVPVLAKTGLAAKLGVVAKVGAIWRGLAEPIGRALQAAGSGAAESTGALVKGGVAALCAASLAGGGHWVAPKLAHPDRRGTKTTRTAAAPSRSRPPQVVAATEPIVRPAAVLTPASVTRVDRRHAKRKVTRRTRRHAASRRRRESVTSVAPPAAAAITPAVTTGTATPVPSAPRQSRRTSSGEFGVE